MKKLVCYLRESTKVSGIQDESIKGFCDTRWAYILDVIGDFLYKREIIRKTLTLLNKMEYFPADDEIVSLEEIFEGLSFAKLVLLELEGEKYVSVGKTVKMYLELSQKLALAKASKNEVKNLFGIFRQGIVGRMSQTEKYQWISYSHLT